MKESSAGSNSADKQKHMSLHKSGKLRARSSTLARRRRIPPLEPQPREGAIPLSFAQQRLWFLDQLGLVGAAYNMPFSLRLEGALSVASLERSFGELVRRHEILRTRFVVEEGSPVQIIDPAYEFRLSVRDISGLGEQDKRSQFDLLSAAEARRPFDLQKGPLLRASLVRLAPTEHVLLITVHHIVFDGWSIGLLNRELGELYRAYSEGTEAPLVDLPIQYADYAIWQRQWLQGEILQGHLEYWRERLRDAPPELQLPGDRPRPAVASFQGATLRFELPMRLRLAIESLARSEGATLFMAVLAAYQILLARYTGQKDVVIGFDTAGRTHVQTEGLIGFFINMLVMRLNVSGGHGFREVLRNAKELALEAYAHQDLPFETLVSELRPERNLMRQPIFQVTLSLKNLPEGRLELPGLTWTSLETAHSSAPFDLTLQLSDSSEAFRGEFEYATDLFDRQTIERMVAHFEMLLWRIVADPEIPIERLEFIGNTERQRLLGGFNGRSVAFDPDRLIHHLFEEQAQECPEALAIVCEDQHLTYAELDRRSNRVARALRAHGVRPDDRVGLYVGRGVEMGIGLLGILKSGGAYVPLDPSYPRERIAYLLRDSAPVVVVTQNAWLKSSLLLKEIPVIILESDFVSCQGSGPIETQPQSSRSLAYVIYTSGSTGDPKGVMVTHRNLLSSTAARRVVYGKPGRFLLMSPFGFDSSIAGIFGTLTGAGTLVIGTEDMLRDVELLCTVLEKFVVTSILCVPSLYRAILSVPGASEKCDALTRVVVAGEACPPNVVIESERRAPGRTLFNEYGPTETTVWATVFKCSGGEQMATVPIGQPIANTQIHILDAQYQLVPIGVTGEIFIAGEGVARGYLNRPALTAERFIANPFRLESRERMYRSGDLGRWRADGTIEYLGRNDHQVKIRGFRIELEEIAAQLVRHAEVKEAVTIAREEALGDKRLVAYVTIQRGNSAPSGDDLKAYLKRVLPEYMVPTWIVVLEKLPLTPNGKLDRQALPTPELGATGSRQYEAPQGEVEEILAGVWRALLNLERVGRWDNFFGLGGHSLLIVQMMERLRRLGLAAEARRVYENPILADLASTLTYGSMEKVEIPEYQIPPGSEAITPQMVPLIDLKGEHIDRIARSVPNGISNIQDIYPLAPLQEGILFYHLLNVQGGDAYVWPTILSVTSRERVDALIVALQTAIDRHDALRTAVLWENLPHPVQVVYRSAILPVEEMALRPDQDPKEQINEWIQPERQRLDLRQAPLLRLIIAADPNTSQWYVLLQLHQLTCDHVSLEIMMSEVVAHMEGRKLPPPDATPYRNHVAQILAHARTRDVEEFFRKKLAAIDEPTAPFGLLEIHGNGSQIDEAQQRLDPRLAHRIRTQARGLGVSTATLFHAAWSLVVGRTSGRDDVVFGSVLLGRLQGNAGAQRILGLFINTLPLRIRLRGVTVKELIEQTQKELVELLIHEQASLAAAQRCSGVAGSSPIFTALLNYRHSGPGSGIEWGAAAGVRVIASYERTNYPITLSVDDLGEGFALTAQTDRRIDPRRMLDYLQTAMLSLVSSLEERPHAAALELCVVPEEEKRKILDSFNPMRANFPQGKLVHELVERWADIAPDAVAVIHEWKCVTYATLNARANQFARYLLSKGASPDRPIAICVERGLEMVIGILAILKAGSGYLPLDPSYPPERLRKMLDDASPNILLTTTELIGPMHGTAGGVLSMDTIASQCSMEKDGNLSAATLGMTPDHLVYLIYTSGSTGSPKGTCMGHRAMVSLIDWHQREFTTGVGVRVLQFAALSFDVAFQEIFSTLCSGNTLVLLTEWTRRDVRSLTKFLGDYRIERLFIPPLMLLSLAEYMSATGEISSALRDVITAGEQLRVSAETRALFTHLHGCRLHNHYGPTETHVVTALTLTGDSQSWAPLPSIGRPISNALVYILDKQRKIVPVGVAGEVYIGGVSLARGYLGRPELTAERFIADPFCGDLGARMYCTGDLGRWQPDGTLEYLGRNDFQVKVRGYRIELGEIEAKLVEHPQIKDTVVVVRQDSPGEKRIVAYVTSCDSTAPAVQELQAYLKTVLPEYMVPSAIVPLRELPLTPSGKLDRRALPVPEIDAYASQRYEPPQGEMEEILVTMWRELLHVERVGRRDNFFDLGGHSLLATQLIVRLQTTLSLAVPVRAVFEFPTLQQFSAEVEAIRQARLIDWVAEGGSEVLALIEKVRWMPESDVQRLIREMKLGAKS